MLLREEAASQSQFALVAHCLGISAS